MTDKAKKKKKKIGTVVFDFDGVIHCYKSGWKGEEIIADEPVEGIKEAIDEIRNAGYKAVIVSTRCATLKGMSAMAKWLKKYEINVDLISSTKPPAKVYIDDRAICFDGNANLLLEKINNFETWYNKEDKK